MDNPTPPTPYSAPPPPPPPPPILPQSPLTADHPPAPPPKPTSRTATPHTINPLPQPPPPSEPYIPSETLTSKTLADLQYLANSPALLDALFHSSHPVSSSTTASLTSALTQNRDLAQNLTASATSLQQLREIAERRLLETKALERRWQEKEKEMYQSLQRFSSPAMYVQLVNALAESEAVGEGMVDSFLEGKGEGEQEFVKEYRAQRRLVHLRRERRERWDEGRVGGWR